MTRSLCDLFTQRFFAKPRFQTPSHPEGESAGQREGVAYWIASKLPACHGERYLGLQYEGGSSRSALRPQTSAGLDSPRANHLLAVMDSGDTGIEEVAKKRFDQLLPCSSSPHTLAYAGVKRRKKRLSRSPRLLLALGPHAQACVSGDNGQELGGSILLKGRSLERGNMHASVWVVPKLEVDCGPLASFLRFSGNRGDRITG